MSGPRVSSGTDSKQDYGTPRVFLEAVERRFGKITFDLAAHAGNKVHPRYYSAEPMDPGAEAVNSLDQVWHKLGTGLLWLNPPFKRIAPWAEKCASASVYGSRIAFLVPASIGSNWFRDQVAPYAAVYLLNGRMSFDGEDLFPKDCMLAVYGDDSSFDMAIWDWQRDRISQTWGTQ